MAANDDREPRRELDLTGEADNSASDAAEGGRVAESAAVEEVEGEEPEILDLTTREAAPANHDDDGFFLRRR